MSDDQLLWTIAKDAIAGALIIGWLCVATVGLDMAMPAIRHVLGY